MAALLLQTPRNIPQTPYIMFKLSINILNTSKLKVKKLREKIYCGFDFIEKNSEGEVNILHFAKIINQ